MSTRWPADTVFTQQILTVEQQECSVCGHDLTICDHRIHTLNGPLEMIGKLAHCPYRACAAHSQTLSPLAETQITLPGGSIVAPNILTRVDHRPHLSLSSFFGGGMKQFSFSSGN